ncbi:bifunctional phosphopantothenoylcysteine decarboxylase/phosphopantothenate--cysteine ligase CoaBC [Synechococcus sp. RS9916]|uniref:bifunctional phosphopantothenoylcysteine decarboxylase/phosphopantothenate--cysteine ligase CoaBC n=1 Tax=Synechococcus sp. RS9916 TaxID=221359 RepID=UPI0000E5478C|nr:bifunctional phosphopantothenoylcysteine decarboxylase/phosphopantothenate--cysteine ligase CoaBC [Synechococcus sp. RS9916]EAU72744.1 putative p-pantothenate cysteine ligase and p-pantothenenoylcysteine decarboxylase [Synechococcus sp. RS9916]
MKTESGALQGRRILVAVSGSIAAVKTPLLVSALVKAGAQVRCVVTPSAAQLVSPVALASLSRHRCYQDDDQWDPREPRPLHVALAEWAELVIVAPLSASTLARWTQGMGDGLLASLLLACERPVVAAAAMNTGMWSQPAVRRNWALLADDPRVLRLAPESGLLACDRIGDGRMADPELIRLAAESALLTQASNGSLPWDWQGRTVLVSAGPTVEGIDPARVLSNRSSGRMGVLIAQAARFRGASVHLVHGPLQLPLAWLEGLHCQAIESAEQMQEHLHRLQANAAAVVMAAAVADWRRQGGASVQKAPKADLQRTLAEQLEPVPDLLKELQATKPDGQRLLGFAALSGSDDEIQALARDKRAAKGCDLLMANPIDRNGQGFGAAMNGGWLVKTDGSTEGVPVMDKLALAHRLLDQLVDCF